MGPTGSCLCGKVRFRSSALAQFSIICCCAQCQKITGTGHAPQLALPREAVTIDGEPARYELKADSGNVVTSAFCKECGSPIYKTSSGFPQFVFFHAGSLDDPSSYDPQQVVWTRKKQPWDFVNPALPTRE